MRWRGTKGETKDGERVTRPRDQLRDALRKVLFEMGVSAEAILDKAVRAFLARDGALASEVKDDDLRIDRLDVEMDRLVIEVLALQAPVASDLREVLACKMTANELERVGDLARNIAKAAMRMAQEEPVELPERLEVLAQSAREALRMALDAFSRKDVNMARGVLEQDDMIDEQEDLLIEALLRDVREEPSMAFQRIDAIVLAKHLERVGDHATNIAEHVVFMVEGRNLKHAEKFSRDMPPKRHEPVDA